jgi:peptidoglycan/xylan/chitin deacetylase (PgdA/CDA1 family)
MSQTPGIQELSLSGYLRRIISLGISLTVFLLDSIWLYLRPLFKANPVNRCTVLYYHSVPEKYAGRFKEQMELALKLAVPLPLDNLQCHSRNKICVAITFDDSLESFYNHAVPILSTLRVPAAVFAVSDALGARPSWGEGYYLPDERLMSAKQLESLPDLITVGSHTRTHPNLVCVGPDRAAEEIMHSRTTLEAILQRPVTLFSFPHGQFDEELVSRCREAGYERVFTTEPRRARQSDFVIGRFSADPWDWQLEFRLKIMGAYRWQAWARKSSKWVRNFFSLRYLGFGTQPY